MMTNYIFKSPIVREGPAGKGRLFSFFKLDVAVSIKKVGGVYSKVRFLLDDQMDDYQEFYRGGYRHTVDDATKAALIAGGVGVTEANFTAV